ncbi:MAG: CDP-glycerol glycerophosphotransferase family protein [Candidatus Omnitrophica bacterium]|nr:CDP-glycerol glycerophosphotransferase family protein [Candidatus Omnitrophota bacterium]
MKNIIFVARLNSKNALSFIKSLSKQNSASVIVATDLVSIQILSKEKIPYKLIENIINTQEMASITERAVKWARCWHKIEGIEHRIKIYGVNVGEIIEIPFILRLSRLLEYTSILDKLCNQSEECKIFIVNDRFLAEIIKTIVHNINYATRFKVFTKEYISLNDLYSRAKQICKKTAIYIISYLWWLRHGLNFYETNKETYSILLFEALDRFGDFTYKLRQSFNCVSLYPSFSWLYFSKSKKTGTHYRTLRPILFWEYLWLRQKAKVKFPHIKEILKNNNIFIFNNTSFASAVFVELGKLFIHQFPCCAAYAKIFKRDISNFRLVITTNDTTPIAKLIVKIAKAKRVRTLVIQHGVTTGGEVGKFNNSSFFGFGFLPLTADVMAIAGNISKDWLVSNGVMPDKLKVTGLLHLDEYFKMQDDKTRTKQLKEDICKKFNFSNKIPLILFVSQHSAGNNRISGYQLTPGETYKNLVCIAKALKIYNKKANLLVKLHPVLQEDESLYRDILISDGAENAKVTRKYRVSSLVLAADLVITCWSTVGMDAIFANKPLITLNLSGTFDKMPYAEKGAAIGVASETELSVAISNCLSGSSTFYKLAQGRGKFSEDYNTIGSKTAAENILDLIYELLNPKTCQTLNLINTK